MISKADLMELFLYEPSNGVFTRLKRTSNRITVGSIAGSKDAKGYLTIQAKGKTYKAHRLAWLYFYGVHPAGEIDHINGVKDDNRIKNLRDVPKAINQQNRRNVKGYSKDGNRWKAQIRANGIWKHLGCYETEGQAHAAYLIAKDQLHVKAREQ